MKQYQHGDILLLAFPFSSDGTKRRPALVLVDTGDSDILVARVTSAQAQTKYDVIIQDWQGAGLLAPSVIRLNKLATVEKSLVERQLGGLIQRDNLSVTIALQAVFVDWLQP